MEVNVPGNNKHSTFLKKQIKEDKMAVGLIHELIVSHHHVCCVRVAMWTRLTLISCHPEIWSLASKIGFASKSMGYHAQCISTLQTFKKGKKGLPGCLCLIVSRDLFDVGYLLSIFAFEFDFLTKQWICRCHSRAGAECRACRFVVPAMQRVIFAPIKGRQCVSLPCGNLFNIQASICSPNTPSVVQVLFPSFFCQNYSVSNSVQMIPWS